MKIALAGLAIVAAAVGGGIGYAGMQTTELPEWYSKATDGSTQQVVSNQTADGTFPDGYSIESNAVYEDAREEGSVHQADERTTVISAGNLNQMVTDAIAQEPYTAPILDIAKDINTAIQNGRVESGATINLSDLPLAALPAEGRQAVEQLTQTFPFLANRDVYLGVEGRPKIVDGALSLDDTHIRLGQLKLPVGSVARQLGLSQGDIEQQIDALLSQQGLTLNDVDIVDGQLIVKGQ